VDIFSYFIGNAVGQRRKGELREDIDRLTRGGALIEAVLATHPFHAHGFEPFYAVYGGSGLGIRAEQTKPARRSSFTSAVLDTAVVRQNTSHIKYYGTPRHIRKLPHIPWVGDGEHLFTLFFPDCDCLQILT
jgi:hypothetical protein